MLFIHHPNTLLRTTNVYHKCLAMRVLLAYLRIYVCELPSLHVFVYIYVYVYHTPARISLKLSIGSRNRGNSDTDVCGYTGKETQTYPDIISLRSET